MIIQFSNGAGIESSVIASIHTEPSRVGSKDLSYPPRIHVYTFREGLGLGSMFGSSKPTASHFMSIQMPSDLHAENECRRLVAKWMGLPEPTPIPDVFVSG